MATPISTRFCLANMPRLPAGTPASCGCVLAVPPLRPSNWSPALATRSFRHSVRTWGPDDRRLEVTARLDVGARTGRTDIH